MATFILRIFWRILFPVFVSALCYSLITPIYCCLLFYRAVILVISKLLRPDLNSMISDYDTIFISEKPGKPVLNLSLWLVVNGDLTVSRIRQMFFEHDVINLKNPNGERLYSRLSQTWTTFMGYAFWKNDPEFKIENHVRNHNNQHPSNFPQSFGDGVYQQMQNELLELPWNPNQSPWEFLVISNFPKPSQTLLIIRYDHILSDVYSMIGLIRVLFQSPFSLPEIRRNKRDLPVWQKLRVILTMPFELAKPLPILLKGRYLGKNDPSKNYNYQLTPTIPISTIKEIKKTFNVEFATVTLSAVNAAICRALEAIGKEAPDYLDFGIVIGLPDHPQGLCNHWISYLAEYPCKSPSSLDRLYQTESIVKKFETSVFPIAMAYSLRLMSKLPAKMIRKIVNLTYARGPSCCFSAFPACATKEFIDGAEVVDAFPCGYVSMGMGLATASWGVNNEQRISFMINENILDSQLPPDCLSKFFMEELQILLNLEK